MDVSDGIIESFIDASLCASIEARAMQMFPELAIESVVSTSTCFWWRIEILPALESWEPALAWVHDHPALYCGA